MRDSPVFYASNTRIKSDIDFLLFNHDDGKGNKLCDNAVLRINVREERNGMLANLKLAYVYVDRKSYRVLAARRRRGRKELTV